MGKSVKHRMDGMVLFKGIYDDVTHNIVCIIFENDLRDNVVIDVKNLSFTERTLKDVVEESEKEFTTKDAAGNKISYRIVVKDQKVIGVLTKFGNEIKEMAFIEHSWLKEGVLVQIPSRNMMGIIKCIPTGLIVTNDPNRNIAKKSIQYPKNVNSRIARKHCADLDGFVDVAIVSEGDVWRQTDNPLCQAFVVTDLQKATVDDETLLISYRQTSSSNMTDSIKSLMQMVDDDFEAIKNKNKNANDDALT